MSEKAVGYLLIALGLLIIVYSAFSVFSVFNKKSSPIDIFNLEGISLDLASFVGSDLSPEEKSAIDEGKINTKAELISPDVLNSPLNYTFHLLFMSFIASVGFKIASLGVMLVRPIKVKLKDEKSILLPDKESSD